MGRVREKGRDKGNGIVVNNDVHILRFSPAMPEKKFKK